MALYWLKYVKFVWYHMKIQKKGRKKKEKVKSNRLKKRRKLVDITLIIN